MQDLLDIREAAEFLRVSETSLRRWTNAGLLRCLRIGGKRERRFRRSDLLAFAGASSAPGNASQSHHSCGFYTSELARAIHAASVTAAGLQSEALCLLVVAKDVQDAVLEILERDRPSVRDDVHTGRLILSEYHDSASAQLDFWGRQFRAASKAGVTEVRVVGDVSGGALGHLAFDEAIEYEHAYGRCVAGSLPVTTLCQYDARRLSGLDAVRLLDCHDRFDSYRSKH